MIPPLTCLHMNHLGQIICKNYKVTHINSVTRLRHPTLSIYINYLGYYLNMILEYVNDILIKITFITLDFFKNNNQNIIKS